MRSFFKNLIPFCPLLLIAFITSGTDACQKDYCVACNAEVGTRTPTQTSTPTEEDTTDDEVIPDDTETPTPTATATPKKTKTPTPTATSTSASSSGPPARSGKSIWSDVASETSNSSGTAADQNPSNWLGSLKAKEIDSDSDGFSDELEDAFDTDKNDPASHALLQSSFRGNIEKLNSERTDSQLSINVIHFCGDITSIPANALRDAENCMHSFYATLLGRESSDGDSDQDGVPDEIENLLHLDSGTADSDKDGVLDWAEIYYGSNPLSRDF
jgi:hypothetical protein